MFLHFVLVEFALHAFITEPWESQPGGLPPPPGCHSQVKNRMGHGHPGIRPQLVLYIYIWIDDHIMGEYIIYNIVTI